MRGLRSEERLLWREAMRGVARLGREMPAEADGVTVRLPHAVSAAKAAPQPHGPAPHVSGTGLDRRSAQRLKRGQMPIEAWLDLHGMTQAEAHCALHRFITASAQAGRRNLLVITGKGSSTEGGVLRAAVPHWLAEDENRARVLAFTQAQPRHGGAGALYLLLRRRR